MRALINILRWYLMPWTRPRLSKEPWQFTGVDKVNVINVDVEDS